MSKANINTMLCSLMSQVSSLANEVKDLKKKRKSKVN